MIVNHIKYNGETSIKYGLRIHLKDYLRVSPADRVGMVEVDGVDGVLLEDLESIESVTMPLPFHIYDINKAVNLTRWLRKEKGYSDLELSWDGDYIYKASFHDKYDLETLLKLHGKVILNFTVKPWKYLKSGLEETEALTLYNPTPYESKPTYIVEGQGAVTVTVNGQELKFIRLNGTLQLDTEREVVTGDGSFSNLETYPFPRLISGYNTLTVTGGSLRVIPKWRERL